MGEELIGGLEEWEFITKQEIMSICKPYEMLLKKKKEKKTL